MDYSFSSNSLILAIASDAEYVFIIVGIELVPNILFNFSGENPPSSAVQANFFAHSQAALRPFLCPFVYPLA